MRSLQISMALSKPRPSFCEAKEKKRRDALSLVRRALRGRIAKKRQKTHLRNAVHADLVLHGLAERALGTEAAKHRQSCVRDMHGSLLWFCADSSPFRHVVTELRVKARESKGWVSAMTGTECE